MESLSVRPLSAELAEKAKAELNENPKRIFDDLEALRTWLAKQPHINARQGTPLNTHTSRVYNFCFQF